MGYPDCLVFDIGGTTFRAGVFTSSQRLVKPVLRRPSPSVVNQPGTSTPVLQEQLLESILEAAEHLKSAHPHRNLKYIGIAVPGPTDSSGKILTAPPLWGKANRNSRADRRAAELRFACPACGGTCGVSWSSGCAVGVTAAIIS